MKVREKGPYPSLLRDRIHIGEETNTSDQTNFDVEPPKI